MTSLPQWKQDLLEKKRRSEEAEMRLKQEELKRISQMPAWKRELVFKRKGVKDLESWLKAENIEIRDGKYMFFPAKLPSGEKIPFRSLNNVSNHDDYGHVDGLGEIHPPSPTEANITTGTPDIENNSSDSHVTSERIIPSIKTNPFLKTYGAKKVIRANSREEDHSNRNGGSVENNYTNANLNYHSLNNHSVSDSGSSAGSQNEIEVFPVDDIEPKSSSDEEEVYRPGFVHKLLDKFSSLSSRGKARNGQSYTVNPVRRSSVDYVLDDNVTSNVVGGYASKVSSSSSDNGPAIGNHIGGQTNALKSNSVHEQNGDLSSGGSSPTSAKQQPILYEIRSGSNAVSRHDEEEEMPKPNTVVSTRNRFEKGGSYKKRQAPEPPKPRLGISHVTANQRALAAASAVTTAPTATLTTVPTATVTTTTPTAKVKYTPEPQVNSFDQMIDDDTQDALKTEETIELENEIIKEESFEYEQVWDEETQKWVEVRRTTTISTSNGIDHSLTINGELEPGLNQSKPLNNSLDNRKITDTEKALENIKRAGKSWFFGSQTGSNAPSGQTDDQDIDFNSNTAKVNHISENETRTSSVGYKPNNSSLYNTSQYDTTDSTTTTSIPAPLTSTQSRPASLQKSTPAISSTVPKTTPVNDFPIPPPRSPEKKKRRAPKFPPQVEPENDKRHITVISLGPESEKSQNGNVTISGAVVSSSSDFLENEKSEQQDIPVTNIDDVQPENDIPVTNIDDITFTPEKEPPSKLDIPRSISNSASIEPLENSYTSSYRAPPRRLPSLAPQGEEIKAIEPVNSQVSSRKNDSLHTIKNDSTIDLLKNRGEVRKGNRMFFPAKPQPKEAVKKFPTSYKFEGSNVTFGRSLLTKSRSGHGVSVFFYII